MKTGRQSVPLSMPGKAITAFPGNIVPRPRAAKLCGAFQVLCGTCRAVSAVKVSPS